MTPLQPFVEFVHFLRGFLYYFFGVSHYIGRTIISIFSQVYLIIKEIFLAIFIICEELYLFIYKLEESISEIAHYVSNTTNNGINLALDTIVLCYNHLQKSLTSTRIHTRLLATGVGNCITKFLLLLHDALILIADACWWLLTLIPRLIFQILVEIGDVLVFTISGTSSLVATALRVLLDDVFKLTTAIIVLYFLVVKRRQLFVFVLRLMRYSMMWIRRILRTASVWRPFPIFRNASRVRSQVNTNGVVRIRLAIQNEYVPNNSSDEQQSCVVCRELKKTVLLLPCKHLCLCERCADVMFERWYAPFCPLCRSAIEQSMSVYT